MSEDTPLKALKKHSRLFILLAFITVILCGRAGYDWWLLKQKKDTDQLASVKVEPPAAPVFMPLDNLIINMITADNNPNRVLYGGLTLWLPEARSRLLRLLYRQEFSKFASKAGKQQLIARIKKALNPPFIKGQPALVISDMLFTSFISYCGNQHEQ
jgi:flagellar FliL protein